MKYNNMKKIVLLMGSLLLVGHATAADESKQIAVDEESFVCLSDMTKVGAFFVTNLLGNVDASLVAAKSETGAKYPVGSLISLVPTEAMVKHEAGWSPETNDWEFFELELSESGSKITTRGTTEVINQFGGNCFDCHKLARPEWDLVCGLDHGCAPIPINREQIAAIQSSDPRCANRN